MCQADPWNSRDVSKQLSEGQRAYSQPSSADLITKAAALAMSSSERRPPKAGMAFFPLVTCVMMDFSESPPARYWLRASFSKVFSGMMTFCPPAWQAAQLALKTCSPASTSAAKTGEVATTAAAAPAATPLATYKTQRVRGRVRGDLFVSGRHTSASDPEIQSEPGPIRKQKGLSATCLLGTGDRVKEAVARVWHAQIFMRWC